MLPQNRTPTHPGEILLEELLAPLGVTPETAWLLSQTLGTTPEFWMHLQAAHDLRRPRHGKLVKLLRDSA